MRYEKLNKILSRHAKPDAVNTAAVEPAASTAEMKLKIALIALLAGLLCVVAIFAAFTSELKIDKTFATSSTPVDISITDKPEWADGDTFIVGSSPKTHTITVTNAGVDCYIRYKSVYTTDNPDLTQVVDTNNHLTNSDWTSGDWVHVGDYFYYTKAVAKDSTLAFDESIINPWDPETTEESYTTLDATVTVEAVQAKNFEPKFDSNSPWGDVKIEAYESSSTEVGGN